MFDGYKIDLTKFIHFVCMSFKDYRIDIASVTSYKTLKQGIVSNKQAELLTNNHD